MRPRYDVTEELEKRQGDQSDDCWIWPGTLDKQGYGVKRHAGRQWRVPRLVFTMMHGNEPAGVTRHRCDNPPCFRPTHLEDGTHGDNALDKVERGRCRNQYTDATHCINGHEFTEANTYRNPSRPMSRSCRECRRKDNRERSRAASGRSRNAAAV